MASTGNGTGLSLFQLLFPETKSEIDATYQAVESNNLPASILSPAVVSPTEAVVASPINTMPPVSTASVLSLLGNTGAVTLRLPIAFGDLIDSINAAQLPGLASVVILAQTILVPAQGTTTIVVLVPDGYVLAGLGEDLEVSANPPTDVIISVTVGTQPLVIDLTLNRPRHVPLNAGVQLLNITGVFVNTSYDDVLVDFFAPLSALPDNVYIDLIHPLLLLNYEALRELADRSTGKSGSGA